MDPSKTVLDSNGNGSAAENPDFTPTSAISTPDLRMDSAVYSSRSDNVIVRLTKTNRALHARVKVGGALRWSNCIVSVDIYLWY